MNQLRVQFKTKKEFRDFIGRLEFVDSYGPINTYKTKFSGQGYQYYVFLFKNHVVAECPQYGNAAYVLEGTDGWQDIFRRSRQELRKNFSHRVTWIRHTSTWKERLGKYLNLISHDPLLQQAMLSAHVGSWVGEQHDNSR